MTRLTGATVDLTDTGYLIIHWLGYTQPMRLSDGDCGVFVALEKARLEVEAEQAACSKKTERSREVILLNRKAAGA